MRSRSAFVPIALPLLALFAGARSAAAQQGPAPIPAPSPPLSPAPAAGAVVAKPIERISLEAAVKRSLNRNPSVIIANEEIRRSEALSEQVRSTWLPILNGNATYTRLDNDRAIRSTPAATPANPNPAPVTNTLANANQINANLQLVVPLVAARQWTAYARSRDAIDLTRLNASDVRRVIAVTAARSYLTVIAQHRLVESAKQSLDTSRALEEYTKTRLGGGVGNRLDYVRAAQQRAISEATLTSAELNVTRAEEALGVIIGSDGPVDVNDDTNLAQPPTLQAALSEAGQKRSDVLTSRERVEITRKAVRDSWTDYMPTLNAVGQPFYNDPATLTQPQTGWQAQLVLQLPLYDGGNRYGLKHERDALHDQAKAGLEGVLRQVKSDVRVAFEAIQRADAALDQAREAERLAREARDLAQLAYTAGATSNLDVVDAQRRLNEAQIAAVIAEDTARQARLDLLAACGRFPGPG